MRECAQLEVRRGARVALDDWVEEYLASGCLGGARTVQIEALAGESADQRLVRLYTTLKDGTQFFQTVRMLVVHPRYGGVRWWWECGGKIKRRRGMRPLVRPCGRRVGTLYFRHERWACRVCHRLVYASRRKG
jgi:hypothetical protein